MKWLSALILSAALLAVAPVASAAPSKPLRGCLPAERESWPVVRTIPQVEGRTILVHRDPKTKQECGEVQISRERPRPPARPKGKR